MNPTTVMSAHGCTVFVETLLGSDTEKTYNDNIDGGLTVFCPNDDSFKNFLPNVDPAGGGGSRRKNSPAGKVCRPEVDGGWS
ncbi:hypothetical protein Vadar_026657 [Vaccinium darrowii]|nr:hypothetical protein Vadar_026657 [Vaccinium darrowii]